MQSELYVCEHPCTRALSQGKSLSLQLPTVVPKAQFQASACLISDTVFLVRSLCLGEQPHHDLAIGFADIPGRCSWSAAWWVLHPARKLPVV
jgi:hypothetical protein